MHLIEKSVYTGYIQHKILLLMNTFSKIIFFIVIVVFLVLPVHQVFAQDASPSSTPSASASPSATPRATPQATASPSANTSPQPAATSSGQVLGGTDKLAETASTKEWLLYAMMGVFMMGIILYGVKLVLTPHVEE